LLFKYLYFNLFFNCFDLQEDYQQKIAEMTQPAEGSSDSRPVDEPRAFYEAVGGPKHGRLYGLGRKAVAWFGTLANSSISTGRSHRPPHPEVTPAVQEMMDGYRRKIEELEEGQRQAQEREKILMEKVDHMGSAINNFVSQYGTAPRPQPPPPSQPFYPASGGYGYHAPPSSYPPAPGSYPPAPSYYPYPPFTGTGYYPTFVGEGTSGARDDDEEENADLGEHNADLADNN
jgi:hypothetical protein